MGGKVGNEWCHVPILLTQGSVAQLDGCPALYVVQGHAPKDMPSNGQEKDMCRLESSGDRIGMSPWIHLWILKAILFFQPFPLRVPPREPCGKVILFCQGHINHPYEILQV